VGLETSGYLSKKDKAYADKFKTPTQPIHLIGVEFSKKTHNVVRVEIAKV